ncbi:hypothetical protein DXG01_003404 [Tephrocybe rancida]|nr:hypothetical protein DXG01_003404 [Tephrocybe rancida]
MSATLPLEVWQYVLAYLPVSFHWKLAYVNSTLLHIFLQEKYRDTAIIDSDGYKMTLAEYDQLVANTCSISTSGRLQVLLEAIDTIKGESKSWPTPYTAERGARTYEILKAMTRVTALEMNLTRYHLYVPDFFPAVAPHHRENHNFGQHTAPTPPARPALRPSHEPGPANSQPRANVLPHPIDRRMPAHVGEYLKLYEPTLTVLELCGPFVPWHHVADFMCAFACDHPLETLTLRVDCLNPQLLGLLRDHLPPLRSRVEDAELLDMFKDLNSAVVVPSRVTVSRDVKEIFNITCDKVAEMLQATPDDLHLCFASGSLLPWHHVPFLALELREALILLIIHPDDNKSRGARLRRFHLSVAEWDLLSALHPLLDVFLVATGRVSRRKVPLIHKILSLFDAITSALDDHIDDVQLPLAVRAAAFRVLHPNKKINYFVKAGWPREWIATAEDIACKELEHYKPAATTPPASTDIPLRTREKVTTTDALEEWLSSAPVNTSADVISWWSAMESTGHPMACMALGFLSIPATSTNVECAFSREGLTVLKMCHSLAQESTRATTVLGSWVDFLGLIPRDDIMTISKIKASHKGTKGKEKAVEDDVIEIEMD